MRIALFVAAALFAFPKPASAEELILPGYLDLPRPSGFELADWCPDPQGPMAEVEPLAVRCFYETYETADDLVEVLSLQVKALAHSGWRSPSPWENSGIPLLFFLRQAPEEMCDDVLYIEPGTFRRGDSSGTSQDVEYVRYTAFRDPSCEAR